jgi:hypothetical protein
MVANDHFRAHGRRRVALVAVLRSRAAEGSLDARVCDLGLGGAGLELESDALWLEAGAEISLEVMAPTRWDPLVVRGEIAWLETTPGGALRAGVRFELREAAPLYALFQLLGAHAYDT